MARGDEASFGFPMLHVTALSQHSEAAALAAAQQQGRRHFWVQHRKVVGGTRDSAMSAFRQIRDFQTFFACVMRVSRFHVVACLSVF